MFNPRLMLSNLAFAKLFLTYPYPSYTFNRVVALHEMFLLAFSNEHFYRSFENHLNRIKQRNDVTRFNDQLS